MFSAVAELDRNIGVGNETSDAASEMPDSNAEDAELLNVLARLAQAENDNARRR